MEEIINNIMQSPENTNPNVLRSQLSKIGGGSGGGVFVVNVIQDGDALTFDKTASEVFAAKQTMPVVVTGSYGGVTAWGDVVVVTKQGTNYIFSAYFPPDKSHHRYAADSDDGYPTDGGK